MVIKWVIVSSKKYLKFIFDADFDERQALDAIKKWEKEFKNNKNEKIAIIWDCSKMNNYSTQARKLWKYALKEMENQIEVVWLITNSSFIKMGGTIMGMLLPFRINIIKSESEIKYE